MNISTLGVYGIEQAMHGMRNPMNSWQKNDTTYYRIGDNDLDLAGRLIKAGPEHAKFLRMIHVWFDIKAPMFWWKEFDTYKVGTVRNSCSTMHKIHAHEFSLDDDFETSGIRQSLIAFPAFDEYVKMLNWLRDNYNDTKDKKYWRALIEMLPCNYMMMSTIETNYAVLRNIYHQREGHKLKEWQEFRTWCESLP